MYSPLWGSAPLWVLLAGWWVANVGDQDAPSRCGGEGSCIARHTAQGAAIVGTAGALWGLTYWASKTDPAPRPVFRGIGGLTVGATVGAVIGWALEQKAAEGEPGAILFCGDADCALVGAVVLGGLGAALGVWSGIISGNGAEGNNGPLRVSVGPQRDGRFGLGLSMRF